MTSDSAIKTTGFDDYVRLLYQLHLQFAAGKSESEDADAIRDQMDAPWRNMTEREIALVRALSADLYQIEDVREDSVPRNPSGELSETIEHLLDAQDWEGTLNFLREQQDILPVADVAFFRGFCWNKLGKLEIAAAFFVQAYQLRPFDRMYGRVAIQGLLKSKQEDRALEFARSMLNLFRDAWGLLLLAEVLFSKVDRPATLEDTDQLWRAIGLAELGERLAGNQPADDDLKNFIRHLHLIRSLSFEQLGQHHQAIEICNRVLQNAPDDENAKDLMRWLESEGLPEEKEDARRALRPILFGQLQSTSLAA